ncbi:ATP-binding protein [Qipengyuania sediminis]|uniref:ATP-binding protein n=1 Tax=Qipengyuania sediminis TaxID=1532023 RepID=UPI00105A7F47|nr:ATP-binding protein [Qipengyuania sediminis]
MDKPLLALTRPPRAATPEHAGVALADDNMRQLVQLRWLAVAGQLAAILAAHFGLGVALPLAPMLAIVGLLALVNIGIVLAPRPARIATGALFAALLTDMAGLTAQLYLSGGTANPFTYLYLLQVALAAILLPARLAALLAAVAAAGVALIGTGSLPLIVMPMHGLSQAQIMLAANWFAFTMVAVLLVVFVVRISRNLRARDAAVAELRERAAEEEGVLRVGLFASGAAHELGTPLSSLAVLVGDWQRHPAFQADPELSEELADAAAELQRCKDTVGRVLHAAGRGRGEAMGAVRVGALLGAIEAEWRATHDTPLVAAWEGVGDVEIASDPSLPQAILNLLENAREARSDIVELTARTQGSEIAIAVRDKGKGFPSEVLAELGRPQRSAKGTGHGIGLFLSASVARRLGGRLTACNLDSGGAEVTLHLPLVSLP